MAGQGDIDEAWISRRIEELTGRPPAGRPVVFHDTTRYMSIDWGHVVGLGGKHYLIRGHEKEGRFGIAEQPKFWVKRALGLEDGVKYILKMTIHENFRIEVGEREFRCWRNPEKEARILEITRGDHRFMSGRAVEDRAGNLVRVLDFIRGEDLLSRLRGVELSHQEYFHALFPGVFARTMESLRALKLVHEAGLCHGDIRNDHIFVEQDGGAFRWIDFDLDQGTVDLDVWSVGNLLHCVAAAGFVTFKIAGQLAPARVDRLGPADASVFFPSRVMNLARVFPCIPGSLNDILMRFSKSAHIPYENLDQILGDLEACAAGEGWPTE